LAPTHYEYQRPELCAYQRRFLDHPARYTIIEAATKTGKTTACLIWLLEQALASPAGTQCWWVAPTQQQARMALRRLKHWLRHEEHLYEVRESQQELTLGHGAGIAFRTGHIPDHLYGEDVHAVVVDEATRCSPGVWQAIRSTLTATRGQAKLIGNVKGRRNWVHDLALRAQQAPEATSLAHFRITAYDAAECGLIAYEEIEDARQSMPEHAFRALYLAEPADDGANPFGLPALRACYTPELQGGQPRFFGLDLAKAHDWTVLIGLDNAGRVVGLDRFQANWEQTLARISRQLPPRAPIVVDSTGVGDPFLERLAQRHQAAEGYHFTSHSKQRLMEALGMALQEQQLAFSAELLYEELAAFEYHYAANGTIRYSAPEGAHDDAVCALALAWHCYRRHAPRRRFDFAL
jgi:hypothetical protein